MNPEQLPGFPTILTGITVDIAIRYSVLAGFAWWLGYKLCKARWWHRKIIPMLPAREEVRREMLWSLSSIAIFGLMGTLTITAARHGWTQLYWKLEQHSWGWFAGSIVAAVFLHDAWFYWTHRLMHLPKLFPVFHRVHHLSRNPTPWAAYAFHPLEAIVQASIFPLVVTVMPIHPLAFTIFMLWQIVFNVLGHTGYEFHPRRLMDIWLKRVLNTPTNHIQHHEAMRGNYGLYFNIWDRLMGTNHERYEERFREVTSRPAPENPAQEADGKRLPAAQ
jgi:lathosterol oxidase